MPYLIVRQPGKMAISLPLQTGLQVGRHEQNDLILDDHQVSRRHAVFNCGEANWHVEDLVSRHGTFVNGQRITSHQLTDSDRIQMGNVVLEFHEDEDLQRIVHHQITAASPPPRDRQSDQRLRLLYDVSRAIGAVGDPLTLMDEMLDTVIELLGCERALVGLGDKDQGIVRRFMRARPGAGVGDVVVSRAIVEATLGRREAVILRDATSTESKTLRKEQILSVMAVPLGLGTRPSGFLYVDDRTDAARFEPQDLDFLAALGYLLTAALDNAERYQRAETMAEALSALSPAEELLGTSGVMIQLKAQIGKYAAAAHVHVLIRGESGTGKELVARSLHARSSRSDRPFVTLNCAAIPETMIESELFGHEKGAFTSAIKSKKGKFVLADGGTLFLDEIGDLALSAQAKVLRAIQEGEVQPLGSERTVHVDVRVVAATHKDLMAEIAAKRFREDLYYRLNVVEIQVPPLRERGQDVTLLAGALLKKAAATLGKRVEGFTAVALAALERHDWPGNVRELRNEVERAVIHAEGSLVDADDLSPRLGAARPMLNQPRERSLAERFAELEPTEKQLVEEALAAAKGNLSEAARLLGITRIMIKRRMDRFGLGDKEG